MFAASRARVLLGKRGKDGLDPGHQDLSRTVRELQRLDRRQGRRRLRMRCVCPCHVATNLGLLVAAAILCAGVAMTSVGYNIHWFSGHGNRTVTRATPAESFLVKFKFLGPIVIGTGIFVFIVTMVVILEWRDSMIKIIEEEEKEQAKKKKKPDLYDLVVQKYKMNKEEIINGGPPGASSRAHSPAPSEEASPSVLRRFSLLRRRMSSPAASPTSPASPTLTAALRTVTRGIFSIDAHAHSTLAPIDAHAHSTLAPIDVHAPESGPARPPGREGRHVTLDWHKQLYGGQDEGGSGQPRRLEHPAESRDPEQSGRAREDIDRRESTQPGSPINDNRQNNAYDSDRQSSQDSQSEARDTSTHPAAHVAPQDPAPLPDPAPHPDPAPPSNPAPHPDPAPPSNPAPHPDSAPLPDPAARARRLPSGKPFRHLTPVDHAAALYTRAQRACAADNSDEDDIYDDDDGDSLSDVSRPATAAHSDVTERPSTADYSDDFRPGTTDCSDVSRPSTAEYSDVTRPSSSDDSDVSRPRAACHSDVSRPGTAESGDSVTSVCEGRALYETQESLLAEEGSVRGGVLQVHESPPEHRLPYTEGGRGD